jgi:glutathione S-transferase
MKLYYAPGACSMASRISLHEAGLPAEFERVDLRSKMTERGDDFAVLNPKRYVPMLVLDDGKTVTENIAVLMLIADREPPFEPGNPLGRTRLIEMLSYLSSELHPAFKPLWHAPSDDDAQAAREGIARRLDLVAQGIRELYLFGPRFSVADAYLFVMLRWAKAFDVALPLELEAYFERVAERPSVRRALAEEGMAT